MQEFRLYFGIGVEHILSFEGLDHLLFIVALTAVYQWGDWRRLLALITAFTVGHSITLACAALGWIAAPSNWIELLIPVTIAITSASNLFKPVKNLNFGYPMALFFGLIHGMGFSASLRAMLGGHIFPPPAACFADGGGSGVFFFFFFFFFSFFFFFKILCGAPGGMGK